MKKHLVKYTGKAYKFIASPFSALTVLLLIIIWFIIGASYFHYNETWFNALEGFAIGITLFMTFVIEYTTHADTKAIHEKLDELIKKHPQADNKKAGIEKRYKEEK